MLFLSTYHNKIDKKGRVSVPAAFRLVLSGQKFQGIIVYGSFINDCIEACSLERMEFLSASIDQMDPYSENRDAFATAILGGSIQLAFDGEGRIMLPEYLLEQYNIKNQVTFVGKGATFELWNSDKFSSYLSQAKIIAKEKRGTLHLLNNGLQQLKGQGE